MKRRFGRVIAAGTFDRLHDGHKKFLETAFKCGEKVYIGVTNFEDYTQLKDKQLAVVIQSFEERLKVLKEYLRGKNFWLRAVVVPLKDKFGPTLEKNDFEAIVVSQQTLKGAEEINQERKKRNLKPLQIVICKTVKDTENEWLSSSRIRMGRVDRQGRSFWQLIKDKNLILAKKERDYFKQPMGCLLAGEVKHLKIAALKAEALIDKEETPLVITVGDIVTQAFCEQGLAFDLAIIDQRSGRHPYHLLNGKLLRQRRVFKARNKAGMISAVLTKTLEEIFNEMARGSVLLIDGEEDQAVLPCLLLAPLNSLIFYGQPDEGIVKIKVTEEVKARAIELLKKFSC